MPPVAIFCVWKCASLAPRQRQLVNIIDNKINSCEVIKVHLEPVQLSRSSFLVDAISPNVKSEIDEIETLIVTTTRTTHGTL